MRRILQWDAVASIGRIAKPDKIPFVSALPKTRSGTFGMRRILRKVAENLPAGEVGELGSLRDTSTLLDPVVVEGITVGRV